ncbi:MAG: YihY/virulence factor BrkB family protein [Candidatus Sulfotelmatobacter sp.]
MQGSTKHLSSRDPRGHKFGFLKIGGAPAGPILHFLDLLRRALWRAFEHDAFAIAKASAYSAILTFFPALLVMGSILATSPKFESSIREIGYALGRVLPAGSATAIEYLRSRTEHPVSFLITTSLLTTWTASGVVISWMEGFRKAYQLPPTWGLVRERLIACSLVILAGVPMTFATILVVFGSQIESRILFHIGHKLGLFILLMWTGLRWAIATLTSIAVIALIYHNAVPRTQRWHSVLPGAALATGMWFGATSLFGWYLRRYGDYSIIYGSLAMGVALLVWMYLISFVVLVGAEFNAMLFPRTVERRSAPTRMPGRKAAAG